MLRVLGERRSACDGVTRREAIRVGGLGLFGSVSLPAFLHAANQQQTDLPQRAKSVVLINLFGGPPHMDMFDLKPNAPKNIRGEMIGTPSAIPGLPICSLMPGIAGLMDEATLIRTYSHKYNSHNPYNVLTGFDGGNDAENYFAKRSDHPSMGSICQHLDIGPRDVPRYVLMPAFPGYGQSLRRAGPYGGYLGSRYDPLFTVCEPKWDRKGNGDYDPVLAHGAPLLPSLGELPAVTADRLDRRRSLLGGRVPARRRHLRSRRGQFGVACAQRLLRQRCSLVNTNNSYPAAADNDSAPCRRARLAPGRHRLRSP